jgi:hypothetical protein
MFRVFYEEDFDSLDLTQEKLEEMKHILDTTDIYKYSFVRDDKVLCSIFFYGNMNNEFHCWSFMSKDFKNTDGKYIKKFFIEKKQELNAKSIFTISENSVKLDRWHKFLGFAKAEKTIWEIGDGS